ncbi:MAG: RsmB/NOP family class I SAM-dependent RNA methyltransferase [Galactobacter sp.]
MSAADGNRGNGGGQRGQGNRRGQGDRSGQGNRGSRAQSRGGNRGSRGAGGSDRRDEAGRQRHRGQGGSPRQYGSLSPAERARTADPSRATAFEVLRAVDQDDAYANLALPAAIRRHHLDRRDAGLATELTYGTLRERGLLDAVVSRCVDRPLKRVDPPVLDVLRLGAYQLLFTRIPAHAALDATVALTRDLVGAGAGGFVNAVLRRVSEKEPEEWKDLVSESAADPVESLALRYSHPAWIARVLKQALVVHGRGAGELEDLLAADNAAPAVNLVQLPGLGDDLTGELEAAGAQRSELVPGAWSTAAGGDPHRLPGVAEGVVRVQDAGSQLVARALAEVELPGAGQDERWLDLCAGPGGKAALSGAIAAQRGAHLVANEVAEHRAELVRKGLAAVPASAWTVRAGDGRTLGKNQPESFDRIMVDAPCSGLGALRRRPEARWRKSAADIPDLTKLQTELLLSGLGALRPGGVLAYVTCSPHPAETVAVIEDVLHRRKDVTLLDTGAALDAAAGTSVGATRPADSVIGSTTGSTVQLFPHAHGTDAMFMALLTRS